MEQILVEVVAPMLSTVEMSCLRFSAVLGNARLRAKYRNDCVDEYPEDWKEAVSYLSEWITEVSRLYRHRVRIRVIDAQTPMGFWMQIRHRLFRFPAFIVDRKRTYIGWDPQELEELIDERIHNQI